jgi:hypothetical protein
MDKALLNGQTEKHTLGGSKQEKWMGMGIMTFVMARFMKGTM